MIDAVVERCAGIDVGKKFILVCVMSAAADESPKMETRTYNTTTAELQSLRDWLLSVAKWRVLCQGPWRTPSWK
jgi:hypothetical protein